MKHHIERTSPKGGPFIGTCQLCGKEGLRIEDAGPNAEDCPNPGDVSKEDAFMRAVTGNKQ